jgi:hypothetical protein
VYVCKLLGRFWGTAVNARKSWFWFESESSVAKTREGERPCVTLRGVTLALSHHLRARALGPRPRRSSMPPVSRLCNVTIISFCLCLDPADDHSRTHMPEPL